MPLSAAQRDRDLKRPGAKCPDPGKGQERQPRRKPQDSSTGADQDHRENPDTRQRNAEKAGVHAIEPDDITVSKMDRRTEADLIVESQCRREWRPAEQRPHDQT
jgi:hypothetical protein